MIKRYLCTALLTIFVFSLSGCIDIYQHITRGDSGMDRHTIKMAVSKTILEMAGNIAGSEEAVDFDGWLDNNSGDLGEYNNFGAIIEKVNTDNDFGYVLRMDIAYNAKTVDAIIKNAPSFVPIYTKDGMTLRIKALGNNQDEDSEYAALFLGMGRYRLTVSKRCLASVNRALFIQGGEETVLDFLDLGDEYLVEVPVPLLMNNDSVLKLVSN